MNKLTLIVFSFSLPFLSACTPSMPTLPEMPEMPDILPDLSLPTLYKDDVQQGSVLTRFTVNQLKIGMSTAQVQDLIGSPSIIDPFHNNQWDYINHSTRHEQTDIRYRLRLNFHQGKLSNIDTSGIISLPALTDKEKALEDQRLAEEAAIEALKQAKIKAQKIAQAKALEQQRLAAEKLAQEKAAAEALKKKTELAKAKQREKAQAAKLKQQLADQQAAKEMAIQAKETKKADEAKKSKEIEPSPWYKFW